MDPSVSNEAKNGSPKPLGEDKTRISWFNVAQERLAQTDRIIHDGIASAKKFSLAKDLDEELKQLAQMLKQMAQMAPIVLAQRNACVPIAFLPAEVLVHILTLSALKPEKDKQFARTKARGWIVASHVCKQWREIVLGHTMAWAEHVFSFSHEYVQGVILKRAGTTPLTLEYSEFQEENEAKRRFDFILQRIHQIKRLDVWIFSHARIATLFLALCSKELPALEELDVSYHGRGFDVDRPFFLGKGPPIVAPQLRKCTLLNCYHPWNMQSLEDLRLSTSAEEDNNTVLQFLPGLAPLLESLHSSPMLRRLRIASYLSADFKADRLVQLPLLEDIYITDKALDRITAILSRLRIPPSCAASCRAALTCDNHDREGMSRSEPSEYEHVSRSIQALALKDANKVSRPFSSPDHLTFSNGGGNLYIDLCDHTLPVRHLCCSCFLSPTDLVHLFNLLADKFHLDHVSSLSLVLNTNRDDALWQNIFTMFPNVRSIHLYKRDDVRKGLQLLQARQTMHKGPLASVDRPFWPLLESLSIPSMNFTTALSSSGKPAVSLAALVYDMLSSRAAAGFRLQTLRIDMLVPNLGDDRPEEEIRKTAPVDAFLSRLLDVVDELQWLSYSNGIVSSLTSPVEPPLTFGSLRHSTGAFARSAPFSVVHDGKSYPTSTHLLEAMKFLPHRPDISESIREAQDDREAERISTRENMEIREDWEQIAQEKADEVQYLKFVQNEGARRMLLLTGNMKLIYEDPDSCWRDRLLKKSMGSEEWNGVGDSLMRVRRRLRRET